MNFEWILAIKEEKEVFFKDAKKNWFNQKKFLSPSLYIITFRVCFSRYINHDSWKSCPLPFLLYWVFFFAVTIIIYDYLPRTASSVLLNCYQWGSCLPCETPTKRSLCRITVNSNFNHLTLRLFTQDSLFSSAELLSMRVLPSLRNTYKKEPL